MSVVQTRPVSTKMPRVPSVFQAINLASRRRVRTWGVAQLRFEDAGLGVPDINAGFPESMSKASTDCLRNQDTTGLICVLSNTGNRSVSTRRDYAHARVSPGQTSIWYNFMFTTSSRVNPSSTIHFHTCNCWKEIRVRITRPAAGIFFYIKPNNQLTNIKKKTLIKKLTKL